jgi:hypothetical protein
MWNGIVECPQACGRTGAQIFQRPPNLWMPDLVFAVHLDTSLSPIHMAVILRAFPAD